MFPEDASYLQKARGSHGGSAGLIFAFFLSHNLPTSAVVRRIALQQALNCNTAALHFIFSVNPLFLKLITLLSLSFSVHSQPGRIIWEMNFDFWAEVHNSLSVDC